MEEDPRSPGSGSAGALDGRAGLLEDCRGMAPAARTSRPSTSSSSHRRGFLGRDPRPNRPLRSRPAPARFRGAAPSRRFLARTHATSAQPAQLREGAARFEELFARDGSPEGPATSLTGTALLAARRGTSVGAMRWLEWWAAAAALSRPARPPGRARRTRGPRSMDRCPRSSGGGAIRVRDGECSGADMAGSPW